MTDRDGYELASGLIRAQATAAQLRKIVEERDAQIGELRVSLRETRREGERLRVRVKEQDVLGAEQCVALDQAVDDVKELRRAMGMKEVQISDLKHDADKANDEVLKLTAELSRTTSRLSSLEPALAHYLTRLEQHLGEMALRDERIQFLEQDLHAALQRPGLPLARHSESGGAQAGVGKDWLYRLLSALDFRTKR